MTGRVVKILAADLLRLRDAIHEAGACSAWSQLRHMADPDMKVALANDGNHWADWQAIAAGDRDDVLGCATGAAECECHRRMGNDFYFLPHNACLIGDAKDCTDPLRTERTVPRPTPKEACTHHRLTLKCPVCEARVDEARRANPRLFTEPEPDEQPDCFTEPDAPLVRAVAALGDEHAGGVPYFVSGFRTQRYDQ